MLIYTKKEYIFIYLLVRIELRLIELYEILAIMCKNDMILYEMIYI